MLTNILIVFGVIFFLQLIFFTYAVIQKTDKVTDLSYGLTFIVASIASISLASEYISIYKWLLALLIVVWGLRLAIYLFIRILKTGKDERFDGIREKPLKFAGFWILQAISVFIILLPTTYALLLEQSTHISTFSYIGFLIAILGILLESSADIQKYIFKSKKENRGKWIQSGLWKYSRHPNYLGEILMWLGVFVYVLPYINDWAIFTVISPMYITYLLLFVTGIPTLEKRDMERYGSNEKYLEYIHNTGILLPKIFVKKS
ncbi:hypothetical protein CVU76_02445 [Candidatus Dojkabacteria bacterium HGW-Dojkabacteria-1]|uniref:Uncharacterized protein n=1 Tax=Candidatus Dojkabacteria bacterium HGW-Dojkabacteria-1 TaxID=2013761 RepID=A0A2N2F3S8_9BACT|nr:MAG: hypothetical protein CVU76_02445 [Candidatus Dojkabacteria bacterium HGW-Dojkabacteria-1]